MPRPKSHTPTSLASAAMEVFWHHGYNATSLDDLVRSTGVSRQGIYSDFGGKRALFLSALERYNLEVVSPAFVQVEDSSADLGAVERYFMHQIERAESTGLPGPGCLVANTMTEIAAHDPEICAVVNAHNERLSTGFVNAFNNECHHQAIHLDPAQTKALAATTVVFAQGLWSASRSTSDSKPLKNAVKHYLKLIQLGIRS
ncbi:MAG: TetR/AcrR family transcriptional regulator [Halioglobus sp.]